jgi:hypothetical protein
MRRTDVRPIFSRRAISEGLNGSAWSQRTSSAFSDAVRGRPWRRPCLWAWAIPAWTHSRRRSHANAAKTASIPACARPVEGVRSNAALSQLGQFAERHHQLGDGSTPPVQPPDHDHVALATPRGLQQALTPGSLLRPQAKVLDLPGPHPVTVPEISRHRLDLQAARLLVVRRDPGVPRSAQGLGPPWPKPLAHAKWSNPLVPAVLTPHEGLADHYPFRPAGVVASGFPQRSGSSSSIRLCGCVLTRLRRSRT